MEQVYFNDCLQLVDVKCHKTGAKNMLENGCKRLGFFLSLCEDLSGVIVRFSEVNDLTEMLFNLSLVSGPHANFFVLRLLLSCEQYIMGSASFSRRTLILHFSQTSLH
jgi:hypothetical protein